MQANEFTHQITQLVLSVNRGSEVKFPFIIVPDKMIVFHLVPLYDCAHSLYFQELSIKYEEQGVQLIHLWEDVWRAKKELVEARIRVMLGVFTSIHARKTTITRIDRIMLDEFLQQSHLQGSPQVKHKYGLFYQKQLVAAASFSDARPILRDGIVYRSVELVRFANRAGYRVVGGVGKLLAAFIEENRPDDLMSYADRDWSSGKSYEKLGFDFIGNTAPQAFWVHAETCERVYAHRLPVDATEEKMKEQGYIRIYNAGSKKYLKRLI